MEHNSEVTLESKQGQVWFCSDQTNIFGTQNIGKERISPDPENVKAIKDMLFPRSKQDP